MRKIPISEYKFIADKYKNGVAITDLAISYDVKTETIRKVLREWGVEVSRGNKIKQPKPIKYKEFVDDKKEECFYCGGLVSEPHSTGDHFPFPDILGGVAVVPCCSSCHDMKDRFILSDWSTGWLKTVLKDFNRLSRETKIFLAKTIKTVINDKKMINPIKAELISKGEKCKDAQIIIALLSNISQQEHQLGIAKTKLGIENARRNGKQIGRRKTDPKKIMEAKELKDTGLSYRQVGKKMGISGSRVHQLVHTTTESCDITTEEVTK